MRVVLLVIALALPAPALAQDTPPELYESAPREQVAGADPSDGGRSVLLLGLALVAVVGAAVLGGLALRRRPGVAAPPERVEPEPEPEPVWHPHVKSDLPPLPAFEPAPVWRPHVKSDLPPLPAFGSGPEPPA